MGNQGIDYFPLNVDFFNDDKIELIEGEFGLKGSTIAIRLLCKIYHEGYYYQWGDDECLLFAKKMGDGIVPGLVKEVVQRLVKRSFFDERLFNSFQILTSKGIQKRYFEASKRRKDVYVVSGCVGEAFVVYCVSNEHAFCADGEYKRYACNCG